MATDDLDDARVLAVLGRLLAAGDPFTALPLVDPSTKLFPGQTMAVLDGRYPAASALTALEGTVGEQADTLTAHGADIDGLTTDVGALETLTSSGRLSAPNLTSTFVAVRTADGQPLAPGTIVVITLDKTLAEITASPVADIADITFEEA